VVGCHPTSPDLSCEQRRSTRRPVGWAATAQASGRGCSPVTDRGIIPSMKRVIGTLCTILILMFSSSLVAQNGVIQGTVLDEVGRPLQGAKVHAELHGVLVAKAIRYVESDEKGTFAIDRLAYGTYDVSGQKEEDGYPDSSFSFYTDKPVATSAVISPEHPAATVALKLGPKAGVITGTVRDALTGKPIPASFMLRASSKRWMGTSQPSKFRVLIPSATDISVEVSSAGYKTWVYDGSGSDSRPLRLEPGSEMRLDIRLEAAFDKSVEAVRFLIPQGFVGWLRLECNDKSAQPSPLEGSSRIFRFTSGSVLATSSPCPQDGAAQEYVYYTEGGSITPVPSDYWNNNGFIWGQYSGFRGGERRMYGFFVGTKEQFEKQPNAPMN